VNNTFYNLSRKDLEESLVNNKVSLKEAIRVVENYTMNNKYEFSASDKNIVIEEGLIWSISLRAHLIIDEHCT